MKRVLVIFIIVLLLWSIIDCIPLQNNDFIFPDDNQPNGIPPWALNHHQQQQDKPHDLPSQRLPSNGNFSPQGGFFPPNGFPPSPNGFPPPPNGFPSQSNGFPPPPNGFFPPNGFPSSGREFPKFQRPKFTPLNPFIEQTTLPTVSIADINKVTTTPSPEFHMCMQNCPVTSEYNPICGSNRALYYNLSKLRCAQRCGSDAKIVRSGSCQGLFPIRIG